MFSPLFTICVALFLSVAGPSSLAFAKTIDNYDWIHSGALRTHADIESQEREVSGFVKLSPLDKLSFGYQTRVGGNYYVEYARGIMLNKQCLVSLDVGYFDMVEEEDMAFGGIALTYLPISNLALTLDYTETESLGTESIAEHRYSAISALWKPVRQINLLLQATHVDTKGKMSQIISNFNEYEGYASYEFANNFEPYIYVMHKDINQDTNINLGVEYNF